MCLSQLIESYLTNAKALVFFLGEKSIVNIQPDTDEVSRSHCATPSLSCRTSCGKFPRWRSGRRELQLAVTFSTAPRPPPAKANMMKTAAIRMRSQLPKSTSPNKAPAAERARVWQWLGAHGATELSANPQRYATSKRCTSTAFLPAFAIGRGSGCAKPFRSTARARNSYLPGFRSRSAADHEIML